MPTYKCKQTGRLFVQFNYQGHTYKRRLPDTATKDDARRLETKLKSQLFFDSNGLDGKPDMLWENFVQDVYLEYVETNHPKEALDRAIVVVRNSLPFLRGKTVRRIKPADLERFKSVRTHTLTRHGRPRKPATVHREFKVLSAAFSMAVRNDLCEYNPCSRVKLPGFDNVQNKVLHLEDETTFLSAFRNGLQRDVALVVLYTGLRQNDVLGLRRDQIDLRENEVQLIQGKTKRRVSIPIHEKVREVLERRMERCGELIFPSYRTGKQMHSIKNAIRFACIRAGIPPLTIRDLRRSYGTRLHELGYDDKTVADLLGHSDTRSVHRYKRGTEIKKKAILELGNLPARASLPSSTSGQSLEELTNLLKILVETKGIEPSTSALRMQATTPIIH